MTNLLIQFVYNYTINTPIQYNKLQKSEFHWISCFLHRLKHFTKKSVQEFSCVFDRNFRTHWCIFPTDMKLYKLYLHSAHKVAVDKSDESTNKNREGSSCGRNALCCNAAELGRDVVWGLECEFLNWRWNSTNCKMKFFRLQIFKCAHMVHRKFSFRKTQLIHGQLSYVLFKQH